MAGGKTCHLQENIRIRAIISDFPYILHSGDIQTMSFPADSFIATYDPA